MAFVSVCIPTYNQVKFLTLVLENLVKQTYQDFEVIVTDDSTTKEVELLVDSYKKQLNIKYYRNEPSLGAIKNWNHSLRLAEGKVVKLMHHDDYLNSETSLEQLVAPFLKGFKGVVLSDALVWRSETLENTEFRVNRQLLSQVVQKPLLVLKGNQVGPPSSLLYPKLDLFYDEQLVWLVDLDFYVRLFSKFGDIKHINSALYTSVQAEHNITVSCLEDEKIERAEIFYILKKYWSFRDFITCLNVLNFWLSHLSSRGQGGYLYLLWRFIISSRTIAVKKDKES